MANIEHRAIILTERHAAHNWEYANAAARTGATGFVSADLGKLARQLDDNSLWMLLAVTPTWLQVSGAAGGRAANPMTTLGDLIVGGASGAETRYGAGTSGHVLTANGAGAAPTWAPPATTTAAGVTNTPAGNIAGVTVQAAINELDTEKVALSDTRFTDAEVVFEFGDGQTAPAVGSIARLNRVPWACTIVRSRISGDVSGSAVVDVQTKPWGSGSFASIAASALPTLAAQTEVEDVALTGWTTTLAAGVQIKGVLNSLTTCEQVVVTLTLRRT